jgi:hypothetical protein
MVTVVSVDNTIFKTIKMIQAEIDVKYISLKRTFWCVFYYVLVIDKVHINEWLTTREE